MLDVKAFASSVQSMQLGKWAVSARVDEDGALSIAISRPDSEDFHSVDTGQADGEGGQMNLRLELEG